MAEEREEALEVSSINWQDGWPTHAYLNNGEIIPITDLYDDNGEPILDPALDGPVRERLSWFIAGPTKEGYWITEQYDDYNWEMHRVN